MVMTLRDLAGHGLACRLARGRMAAVSYPSIKVGVRNPQAALAEVNHSWAFARGNQAFEGSPDKADALGGFVVIENLHCVSLRKFVSCDKQST